VSQPENRKPNRLVHEKSPYLLQHAHNPVDWYPWGQEAFRRAREENKPIFLSIGYSTCHWCHVMERESFENPEIAERMNRWFVSIKVDREERPDIDRVYMAFVQATTGSGGWPLSVWLTPDLKPFFGGTYFPPVEISGRPGFAGMLEQIAHLWQTQQQDLLASGAQVTEQMQAALAATRPQVVDTSVFYQAFKALQRNYDRRQGGFGGAPKFPRPVILAFLLRYYARTGDREAAQMAIDTLAAMARGGLYDHLGGGFHRYSVDETWHVPHFEKMLYDQAQLAVSYLEAYQVSGDQALARVARETIDYVLRDLTDPATGAFYSAEDADSPANAECGVRSAESPDTPHSALHIPHSALHEGAFYVWSYEEIRSVLESDADVFCYHYGVRPEGNAQDPHGELAGKNVLHLVHTVEETATHFGRPAAEAGELLERSRAALRAARDHRARPHRDDKVICAWNGLMISALARAAQILDEPRYLEAARRAARFVASRMWKGADHTLARRFRDGETGAEGVLEDYVFFADGLIELYQAGFELEWLRLARRLTQRSIELFWDAEAGGFFETTGRDPSVLLRLKDDYDGAEPAGNSIAALNLARLADMLDISEWRQRADQTVQAFAQRLSQQPEALPRMLAAFQYLSGGGIEIVLAGEGNQAGMGPLLRTIRERFLPDQVVMLADTAARNELGGEVPSLRGMLPGDGGPVAYVCRQFTCERPVSDPAALAEVLGRPASLVERPG